MSFLVCNNLRKRELAAEINYFACIFFPLCSNPCSAKPGFICFENTVGPDQLTSDKAIWTGLILFSIWLKINTYDYVVSLIKTLYPQLSTDSTQEDRKSSRHVWKIVDRDFNHQNRQTKETRMLEVNGLKNRKECSIQNSQHDKGKCLFLMVPYLRLIKLFHAQLNRAYKFNYS